MTLIMTIVQFLEQHAVINLMQPLTWGFQTKITRHENKDPKTKTLKSIPRIFAKPKNKMKNRDTKIDKWGGGGGAGFMNWKTCIFLRIRKFAFFFVAQVEIQLISLHSCTSHKYRFIYLRPPLEFIWTCDVWPNGPFSCKLCIEASLSFLSNDE